jgi:hypothetical protein
MTAAEMVLAYPAAGVAVLPCRGKLPLTAHGLHDATLDPGQVAEWAARWPGCNWGGRPPEGIVVLDVDPRHGGATSLLQLQDEHGCLPPTLTARTGGGGLHIWLAYRGPAPGRLTAGIDVKTHRGYVILPPSIHPDTRRAYAWIDPDATTAPAPPWLRRLLAPPAPARTAPPWPVSSDRRAGGLIRHVTETPFGEINERLYWAACRAAEGGFLDDIAEQLVAAARHAAGGKATDAGERQSRRTIESARRRPRSSV